MKKIIFLAFIFLLWPTSVIADEGILDIQNKFLEQNKERANLVADLWFCEQGEIATKINNFGLMHTVLYANKHLEDSNEEKRKMLSMALFSYMEGYIRARMELRIETLKEDKFQFCNSVIKKAESYRK